MADEVLQPKNLDSVDRWGEPEWIEFAKIWQAAVDVAEVVAKTGMSPSKVYSKSRQLSKNGVNLKKLERGSKLNWSAIKTAAGL